MKKQTIRLGVSGMAGSFSEEAALIYANRVGIVPELVFLLDMEGVLSALEANEISQGIFPVVNLRGGLVKQAFAAMGKHLFKPIDEVWLDVNQCLMALPGVQLGQIKKIVSHSQALAQCERYLRKTCAQTEWVEWQDTAKAAQDLKQGKLSRDCAVIAPQRSASIYQLDLLAKNIQDNQPNFTAFIIADGQHADD